MCERSLEKRARSEYREVNGTFVCNYCYQGKKRPTMSSSSNEPPATVDETATEKQSITLPFTQESHRKCIFGCEKRVLSLLREDCLQIFIQTRESVYVPYGAHVCCSHEEGDSLTVPDGFAASQFPVSLNANEIALCFETMKNMVISERKLIEESIEFSNCTFF